MAEDNEKIKQPQGGNSATTNSFSKGMLKDYNDSLIGEGLYTHARNAVNNSHDGQVGVIGNEPSNLFCVTLPYTMIGCIHLLDDQWAVFTTNNTDSEIGIFDESACTYKKVVNDRCLNFKTTNLITGVFRRRYDCERLVYWDDGINPTRFMDIDNPPFKFYYTIVNNCKTKVFLQPLQLDCEAIRIASFITHPCLRIKKGEVSGTLPNGTYQACIAYTINGVKVTDYLGLTDPQAVFSHENVSSSLQIIVESADTDFTEFDLVLLTNINAQTTAKKVGNYSTSQGAIYIDRWSLADYTNVPLSELLNRTDPIEKSDAMYTVNNYILRTGVYTKFRFNYQPLANQISTKWVAVQYPEDYYVKGNHNTGYMRDEQYAFFIRFIYNTGEFSDSYHIPGRPSIPSDTAVITGGDDVFDGPLPTWRVYNTATVTSTTSSSPAYLNGGTIVATGNMGYWESTERYPDDRPDIWNSFPNLTSSPLNLCGQPIRHHKMPDETINPILSTFTNGASKITLLGVQFDNIKFPLDINGNPIDSIVGYEILRGSREGNKSIIAKGLLNNTRSYPVPENPTITGLYPNYPYNDLRPDVYLTAAEQTGENGTNNAAPLTGYNRDIFTFHSPDTTFSNPFLNPYTLNVYQERWGTSKGSFQLPYRHPKFKQITNFADTLVDTLVTAATFLQLSAAAFGGFKIDVSADDDLPPTAIGVDKVLSEGPFGSIGTGLYVASIILNAALAAAYTSLIGTKAIKQQILYIVLALIPKRHYAAQYNSYGLYDNSQSSVKNNRRRKIVESAYVGSSLQQFTPQYQINNVNRSRVVTIKLGKEIADPTNQDISRFTISDPQAGNQAIGSPCQGKISSHYGALKLSILSQYGQLDSIKQLCVSTYNELGNCKPHITSGNIYKTGVLFGGDTYINRFTEKNTMFFFNTWLKDGEPDGYEFNYTSYPNIPYPKYWLNNVKYIGLFADQAGDYRNFDHQYLGGAFSFWVKRGYFYLFNSGVRDYFVESEVNVAYRDWEDDTIKRHYDPYRFTDLSLMFRSDLIESSANYYKYDYSLSVSKLVNSFVTWGALLPKDYNPLVYNTCFKYRPNRVIYSLPQQDESKKDNWRLFLSNNYKEFPSPVSCIKPVNKTGALFMMKYQSPLQFLGVEELKLDQTGTKVTIGDGGLFTGPQQLQSVVNADESYEYGSNQGRFCSINTTYGVFWVSQNQGKVFQYSGQLNDITNNGLKWWLAKYLPSQLLAMYPDYVLGDNIVEGVGVQMIYDNTYEIVYVVKRDYKPKFTDPLTMDIRNGAFYLAGTNTPIPLTNTQYFENASFTISFDPKSKAWVSFHDWIPTFLLPGRSHFLSVNRDKIWKHNIRCDSYCNYYGVDYPFEIEFVSATSQQVTSMRSIEYLLEVYNMHNDCRDKYHVLDQNFDQAIVYNSEQISGVLELNIKAKNNPLSLLAYPQITTNSIRIQFSKEENKYRFNQFWDITRNRGEYIPNNIPMFNTEANGYIYPINPAYVDYNKPPLQHKKFRHYANRVFLKKYICGNNKLLFKVSNQKLLPSYR